MQRALTTNAATTWIDAPTHTLDAGGVFQYHEDFVKRALEFL